LTSTPERGWFITRLGREHDRATFDCGHAALNDWLKQQAGQFDQRDLARTFVAVRGGERTVLGYYAISSHGVRRADLPDDQAKGLPRIDVPVVLLGQLAVDRSVQGQGLGSLLLIDALKRSEDLGRVDKTWEGLADWARTRVRTMDNVANLVNFKRLIIILLNIYVKI